MNKPVLPRQKLNHTSVFTLLFVLSFGSLAQTTEWRIDGLGPINDIPTNVLGNPFVAPDGEYGDVVHFDGTMDQMIIEGNPLLGDEFTVEVNFNPDDAHAISNEPRFVHIQNPANDNRRILIELRLTSEGQWYLDGFVKSEDNDLALIDPSLLHETGEWHHAALTYSNGTLTTYVNGVKELEGSVTYNEIGSGGQVSVGARMNQRHYYAGAVHSLYFTDAVLAPEDFHILGSEPEVPLTASLESSGQIMAYPNPVIADDLFITGAEVGAPVSVISMDGRSLSHTESLFIEQDTNGFRIHGWDQLSSGVYYIQIHGQNSQTLKVVNR